MGEFAYQSQKRFPRIEFISIMQFRDITFSTEIFDFSQVVSCVVLVLILIKIAQIFWNRRHLYRLSYQCDGPFAWPFIGNLFDIRATSDGE